MKETANLENIQEKESQFTKENWMVRVNNELHSRFEPLAGDFENLSLADKSLLTEAKKYYEDCDDIFNLFRLELKIGNIEEAQKLAQEFLALESEPNHLAHYAGQLEEMEKAKILELKKAYVMRDLYNLNKDEDMRWQALEKFEHYADDQAEREELAGYEASALGYHEASRLAPKVERENLRQKSIIQFRKMSDNRAQAGDRWWESIALRQIGKISKESPDKDIAKQRSGELINEYEQRGDFKKAALWARDLNDLSPSKENASKMQSLWLTNIEKVLASGDLRDAGKAYWQLWKRTKRIDKTKADEYRQEAINYYHKSLAEAKEQSNTERIRECYWVFCELIK
jgi:hypothetical protein